MEESGQPPLFVNYEVIFLMAQSQVYSLQAVANLLDRMDIEPELLPDHYAIRKENKLCFYLANGFGTGSLSDLSQSTSLLAFILPLEQADEPLAGLDVLLRSCATFVQELGGILVDEQRQRLSRQGLEHLKEKVRQWEIRAT
ncbi:MAG: cell division protein ZipA C-terminal FtsZ-binding domain-containing protein [Gammaproteobacteria bacterium]